MLDKKTNKESPEEELKEGAIFSWKFKKIDVKPLGKAPVSQRIGIWIHRKCRWV